MRFREDAGDAGKVLPLKPVKASFTNAPKLGVWSLGVVSENDLDPGTSRKPKLQVTLAEASPKPEKVAEKTKTKKSVCPTFSC